MCKNATSNIKYKISYAYLSLKFHYKESIKVLSLSSTRKQLKNGELISIKILIVHIIIYFLSYLFLFANWNFIDEVMTVLQHVVIPILILSYHPGFNQFYMSNHPNLRDTTNFIWHFLSIMYIKLCDFLLTIEIFRSNQIQPHNVII